MTARDGRISAVVERLLSAAPPDRPTTLPPSLSLSHTHMNSRMPIATHRTRRIQNRSLSDPDHTSICCSCFSGSSQAPEANVSHQRRREIYDPFLTRRILFVLKPFNANRNETGARVQDIHRDATERTYIRVPREGRCPGIAGRYTRPIHKK